MNIVITILFFLLTILFIVLGAQFRRGKWLRLLSGNTFGDLPKEKAISAGRKTSRLMYFSAGFCLFLWWWITFSEKQLFFWCGIVIVLIVSGFTLIKVLREWIRTGY
ncbi:hypothetical protein [Enterococcus gilvus]|uniref:hypothetical protein n=1 Tax=Enterococcus gilvus TaxID=160453 RepID=UPI0028D4126C|nr:hypothetical protein [Enterococcus gilvus]